MKSLEKALSVLDLIISRKGQDVSISDISQVLDLPKGTTHRILTSLVRFKYVRRDPVTKKYSLGVRFFDIGSSLDRCQTLRAVISPMLRQLHSKCRETVSAAVLVDDQIEYIDRYESDMLLRVSINIGTRFPAHCTGTGKVMLSAMSDGELDSLFKSKARLKRCTDNSVTSLKDLKSVLANVHRDGVARDLEECLVGVHCLAAPIVNHQGEVVAAVSISGPRERLNLEKMGELEPLLRKATDKISQEFQG